MARGKYPHSLGTQLSCMVQVRENWQESGRDAALESELTSRTRREREWEERPEQKALISLSIPACSEQIVPNFVIKSAVSSMKPVFPRTPGKIVRTGSGVPNYSCE